MKVTFTILLCFMSMAVSGQSDTAAVWSVAGKIINATNQEPVTARIVYESLPHAANIGIHNGPNFSFSIPKETPYRLKVAADGYTPYTHDIMPKEYQDGHFFVLVALRPTGANQLIRLEKLIFDQGKANITTESYQELNTIVKMMNENLNMKIQLEGHTDFRGNARQNLRLSEDRVEAVRKYLIRQGVKKRRIKIKAFGGNQPLSRSDDQNSRKRNRRVEVRILSN